MPVTIASRLEADGACATSAFELANRDDLARIADESSRLVRYVEERGIRRTHVPCEFTALHRFGLNEGILRILRILFSTAPALIAVHFREDHGGELPEHLRHWHFDYEDDRMARLILYLSSVSEADCPFEFVPATFQDRYAPLRSRGIGDPSTNASYRAVLDSEMDHLVPAAEWRTCTGPRLTAVIASTARVPHRVRAGPGRRLSLTFTYTSHAPRFPKIDRNPSMDAWVTPEQSACYFVALDPGSA